MLATMSVNKIAGPYPMSNTGEYDLFYTFCPVIRQIFTNTLFFYFILNFIHLFFDLALPGAQQKGVKNSMTFGIFFADTNVNIYIVHLYSLKQLPKT